MDLRRRRRPGKPPQVAPLSGKAADMAARISGSTVCVMLVLTLAAVGCGNDDGDAQEPAATPTQTAPETPAEEPSPTPEPEAEPETYVVQSGDTLSSIAERFDTTIEAIVEANDLDDPDLILVGDELVIPPEE